MSNLILFFYTNKISNINNFINNINYKNIINLSNINLLYKLFIDIKYFWIIKNVDFINHFSNLINNEELLFIIYNTSFYSKSSIKKINNSFLINLNKKYFLFINIIKSIYLKRNLYLIIMLKNKWHRLIN